MPDSSSVLIDADTARFLLSGLSIGVAARDAAGRPSIARACGLRLPPDRSSLRVLVVRDQALDLLADVEALGMAAAVFSEVSSHRTLQIKSTQTRVEPADGDDLAALDAQVERFAATLDAIGHAPEFTAALLGQRGQAIAAIVMRPEQVYSQTPGPGAGARLKG
ncbi:hypothetical protein SAMN04488120_103153 [Fontimonas thermophila]|uniref:Pyridoxamine 5'-phosphate oxidase putative domain-containing protein n=1 Tax=Fontimonas thermophila TaxID=1076937 RepID=A0A1I2IEZ7_9GAMM|nr:hypothetical protein [Fontimonas thermophila]SFF39111.1 hypothetical protein SAMN04488120_103153 [Fontimonas thermophila]